MNTTCLSSKLSCKVVCWHLIGLMLIHFTLCQSSTDTSIVENVLAVQRDGYCHATDPSFNYLFNGGGDYFSVEFERLVAEVKARLSTLVSVNIAKNAPAPSIQVSSSVNAIKALDNQNVIEDLKLVLGDGIRPDPTYCYDANGRITSCSGAYKDLFTTASNDWSYRYDCNGWKALYSAVEVDFIPQSGTLSKVVLMLILRLGESDINQCPGSPDRLFNGTALCSVISDSQSQCTFVANKGFHIGSYSCRCTNCQGTACRSVPGDELVVQENPSSYFLSQCGEELPQQPETLSTTPKLLGGKDATTTPSDQYNSSLHLENCAVSGIGMTCFDRAVKPEIYAMISFQGLCILLCFVIALLVIMHRPKEVIQYSKSFILILILFGAVLNYSTLALKFFPASDIVCYLSPWLREIGFMCIYGAIMLKTYKVLAEFQTRKARRVHIRDKDLLKYWLTCLLISVIYLAAWTGININYTRDQGVQLVVDVNLSQGGSQQQCVVTGWSYVTKGTEFLILAFGLYMSYRLRDAPSYFWESKFYTAALTIELILTLVYHLICLLLQLTLYWNFVLSFLHLQLTTTINLLLIFGPKFYYIKHNPKEGVFLSKTGTNRTDLVDFRTHGKPGTTNNGDVDVEDINIAEMHPDDIKTELKRLYELVHAYQDRVMRYENPHLHSKKAHNKSKLPFYKQKSHHKVQHKRSEKGTSDTEMNALSAADTIPEMEPLNPSYQDRDTGPSHSKRTADF